MDLRQQVMVNQFVYVAGCPTEQAKQFLTAAKWHFESALSLFFQESAIPPCQCRNGNHSHCHYTMCTPANTPVTPPSFPDALQALAKLSAGSDTSKTQHPCTITQAPPATSPTSYTTAGVQARP